MMCRRGWELGSPPGLIEQLRRVGWASMPSNWFDWTTGDEEHIRERLLCHSRATGTVSSRDEVQWPNLGERPFSFAGQKQKLCGTLGMRRSPFRSRATAISQMNPMIAANWYFQSWGQTSLWCL